MNLQLESRNMGHVYRPRDAIRPRGGCHNFTRYKKSSVSVIRMMPSDFANLCYMLDAQLFLQPRFIRSRKHSRRVTLSSVLSRTSQKTFTPVMMWLTLTKGTLFKEMWYFIIPLVGRYFFYRTLHFRESILLLCTHFIHSNVWPSKVTRHSLLSSVLACLFLLATAAQWESATASHAVVYWIVL